LAAAALIQAAKDAAIAKEAARSVAETETKAKALAEAKAQAERSVARSTPRPGNTASKVVVIEGSR
jgi:hypothetical protein